MNKSFSLQQTSETGNPHSNLKSRQYKLSLLAIFMQTTFENPKLKHSEIADQLGYSSSTLQRYRNDINMFSFFRTQANITNKRSKMVSNKMLDNNSHREHGLKNLQMIPKDTNENAKKVKSKNSSKRANPKDVNHSNGRNFIKHAFSST